MRFGSVCSGIEAASVAWEPLGWKAAWFSEIAPFPSRVLAHHYSDTVNHGSLVGLAARLGGDARSIDLLVGGTPCQSFSTAGLRGGLTDERGNLALEFARVAQALRPRWVLWENVPGVLSSGGGRDFGSILGALVELGYGVAYRVLDARHFGVPQRRRRVFLVGCLGNWAAAAAVLFEPEGVLGNPPSRCEAREEVAGTLTGGSGGGRYDKQPLTVVPDVAKCLTTSAQRIDTETETETWRVRRLTPRECERLQGFPDDYTAIPGAADGPRYAALGNSMAVPVMRWLGERIAKVNEVLQ